MMFLIIEVLSVFNHSIATVKVFPLLELMTSNIHSPMKLYGYSVNPMTWDLHRDLHRDLARREWGLNP